MEKELSFEEWSKKLTGADFKTASGMIKEKIKLELDPQDHKFLDDTYNYFLDHYESGLPVKFDNYKTYMVDLKHHKDFDASQFTSFLLLMAICGFKMIDFQ